MGWFSTFTVNFTGYGTRTLPLPVLPFNSYPRRRRLPFASPQKSAGSLCASPSLNGVLLPCIQGLGSLSLPFPPPPLPACDPTLRPHPSSLCQSGAAQPCREAGAAGDLTPAAGRQAGRQAGGRADRRKGAAAAEEPLLLLGYFL